MKPENSELSGDIPLQDPGQDKLGYQKFAERLAKALYEMVPADGLVIALYGAWGSGKTTVLNFVRHYLTEHTKELPDEERPVVIHFNPWWFSGTDKLLRQFFDQVIAKLDPRDKKLKKIRKAFKNFAGAVVALEVPDSHIMSIQVVIRFVQSLCQTTVSFEKLRSNLRELLCKCNQKIIVMIDDVDRLTADEIRQLFTVIKAVVNLPNITYLVAFDKSVVVEALSDLHKDSGEEYLEKIVQAPFDLPNPDENSLNEMFDIELAKILGDAFPFKSVEEKRRWNNIFYGGIASLLDTPRNVNRLINMLSVTYHMVKDVVNTVDFIAIEALRVLESTVYEKIKTHPSEFIDGYNQNSLGLTGEGNQNNGQEAKLHREEFHRGYLPRTEVHLHAPIKRILRQLFPKMFSEDQSTDKGVWARTENMVCTREHFDTYFQLDVPSGAVSPVELGEAIEAARDAEAFGRKLTDMVEKKYGLSKVQEFLRQLIDYTKTTHPTTPSPYTPDSEPIVDVHPPREARIAPEQAQNMIKALFDIGDELLRHEPATPRLLSWGVSGAIKNLITQLLYLIQSDLKLKLLLEIISHTKGYSTLAYVVPQICHRREGAEASQGSPNSDLSLDPEEFQNLKDHTVARFAAEAKSGSFDDSVDPSLILSLWEQWDTSGNCVAWSRPQLLNDDSFLVSFLEAIFKNGGSQKSSLKLVNKFITSDEAGTRIDILIASGHLTELQREALQSFQQTLELQRAGKLRADGEN